MTRASVRSSVDLPLPFAPIRAVIFPSGMARSTSFSTGAVA